MTSTRCCAPLSAGCVTQGTTHRENQAIRFQNRAHATQLLAEKLTAPSWLGCSRMPTRWCVYVPDVFYAVGQFFEDFSQVSDAEAIAILQHSSAMAVPGASHAP